jgi:hypothetical protein
MAEYGHEPPSTSTGFHGKLATKLQPIRKEFVADREKLDNILAERLKEAAERRAVKWNARMKVVRYVVGDVVLV